MNSVVDDILMHYGMPRRSGRYPWGSGEDPYQHSRDFLSRVDELKKQGWKETPENIMKEFGMTTTDYRTEKSNARAERRMLDVATAKSLKEDGLGYTDIGKKMGLSESTVRSLLNSKSEARMHEARNTADFIKEQVDKKGMIDVGTGVELELNVSKEKLNRALKMLEEEGYTVYGGRIDQVTNPGQKTTMKVICPPGTKSSEIYDFSNVHSLKEYITRDGGETFEKKFHYPESLDSKRLQIRYADEKDSDGFTGVQKDGVIELRRGVDDLSLGNSRYSQVRILVDGTHYLKGMAVYADKMPDGVDVIFNTNKKAGTPVKDVLKKISDDPDNPFGSTIKDSEQGGQYWYTDKNGKKKLGLINKRADEGDWTEWKDTLPSQFLSKQPRSLARKQLKLAITDKQAEFDEICSLTNPTIKKHLLNKFADECDSAAVHLKAAALPGQKYHAILPINTLKENEVYAPGYDNGTKLALIRYPHGGTFEIPILTVNNKNALGKKLIGSTSIDAVGITSKIAEQLSGADFDGDTVMCIPTHDPKGKVKIASTPPLEKLIGFDPKAEYATIKKSDGYYDENGEKVRIMSKKSKQTQMGIVSNLITDMTLQGAPPDKMAQAVKHSMVVIDAEKHHLNYKKSEIDNNIRALQKEYQTYVDEDGKVHTKGAATLISRAKKETDVPKRQGSPRINIKGTKDYDPSRPEGALIYKTAQDVSYETPKVNKRTGEVTVVTKTKTQKSTKMAETDDAYTLISAANTPMERIYADYANTMKAMANKARVTMVSTGKIAYDKNANATYKKEVDDLDAKLKTALINKPKEREAQRRANVEIEAKKAKYKAENGIDMDAGDVKKISQQALKKYRNEVDTVARKERNIEITDREWEAIQAGAISEDKLKKILDNTDTDKLRQRATPKATTSLSTAQINRIKAYSNSNYTLKEISKKLNIPSSTVAKYLKGVN